MKKQKQKQRWYIQRIKLNSQGYDSSGNYYGLGGNVFYCYSQCGNYDFIIRGTRETAKCAYQFVQNASDKLGACLKLNTSGM